MGITKNHKNSKKYKEKVSLQNKDTNDFYIPENDSFIQQPYKHDNGEHPNSSNTKDKLKQKEIELPTEKVNESSDLDNNQSLDANDQVSNKYLNSIKAKWNNFKTYSKKFIFKTLDGSLVLHKEIEDTSKYTFDIVKNSLTNTKQDLYVSFYSYIKSKADLKNIDNSETKNKSKHIIEVKNLYMRYSRKGDLAIKNCSFNIDEGNFHVFVGQNGAGKSTIIRMIIGLNLDYQGQIFINGIDGKNHISRKDMIFIPDKPIFPTEWTSLDYLMEFAKLHCDDSDELLKEKINNYLNEFEIPEVANRNPNKLSSGQKQKILIIKILLLNSKIIVLDEPTSNLDTITRKQVLDILKKLTIENKVTVFISTHVLEEIKKYADSATFIEKGKILWSGKVKDDEIVKKHNELFGVD